MDKKFVIGIPILFPGYSISLPPPCVYCGRPIDPQKNYYWTKNGMYQTVHWGQGRKFGDWQLWPDKVPRSTYSINLPYCPEHLMPISKKSRAIASMPIIGFLVGIFVLFPLLAFILSILKLDRTSEITIVIIGAIGLALGGYLAGRLIYSDIAKKRPILKDIPAFMSGQYGVQIGDQKTESERPGAPVYYYLQLTMSDERIVNRFLEYFPGIKIYKGQNYINQQVGE